MNKAQRLTDMAPNGYCEYGSRDIERAGEIITIRGWWWRQTPKGKARGPSYEPIFIGSNYLEAQDYAFIHWS